MPNHEFRAKISRPLSKLKHKNVVELVVYNLDGLEQVLAYDFDPRGSLHDILHEQRGLGSKPYPALSWSQRIQIALGVARGLCYIHDHYKELIHHNIRSSNILLCSKIVVVDNAERARQRHLVSRAFPQMDSDKVHEIVDARLQAYYLPDAVKKMAQVAQLSLQRRASNMGEVVRNLELCLGETAEIN
ncbi:receptor-like protein kinase ANXUR2 isoform X2 [Salvia divinorum]|uniref:Receptor-like protein kinase ANXUR2 isoform X2 n=1 Tax=Salvia divinorum TaxID=28513 RepID=A0ABD1GE48_SALDI